MADLLNAETEKYENEASEIIDTPSSSESKEILESENIDYTSVENLEQAEAPTIAEKASANPEDAEIENSEDSNAISSSDATTDISAAKAKKLAEIKAYYSDIYKLISLPSAIDYDTKEQFEIPKNHDTRGNLEKLVLAFAQSLLEARYFEILDKHYYPLPGTRQISQKDAEELREGYISIRVFNIIQKEIMEIEDYENHKHRILVANMYSIVSELIVGYSEVLEKKWQLESDLEAITTLEGIQNFEIPSY